MLLIHENYGLFRFGPPGGTMEPGETPQETAAREVLEETGLIVEIGAHLLSEELMGAEPFMAHAFEATIVSGEPHLPRPEEIGVGGLV
ncbi:NUDIX domain-containing protein [Stackebrandtia endophytica]|uniref:NUDIX domain-containing protein n=2 Tax=Stackebrandtia endophytica TaxID=1496996 RepID=A0A543ATL6_9ACTN|nr:NUDIX domain-containing protein [Stackebrandtia endophytica]